MASNTLRWTLNRLHPSPLPPLPPPVWRSGHPTLRDGHWTSLLPFARLLQVNQQGSCIFPHFEVDIERAPLCLPPPSNQHGGHVEYLEADVNKFLPSLLMAANVAVRIFKQLEVSAGRASPPLFPGKTNMRITPWKNLWWMLDKLGFVVEVDVNRFLPALLIATNIETRIFIQLKVSAGQAPPLLLPRKASVRITSSHTLTRMLKRLLPCLRPS